MILLCKQLSIKNFFQIKYQLNRIVLYNGPDEKSMRIGEVFGTLNHKIGKSISSTGKSIFIDFKKQFYYGTVEFLTFIKYNKINPDCQSWLNNNILMSPNDPNINCSWIITRKFGSYITLDFDFIEVKQIDNNYHNIDKLNYNSL